MANETHFHSANFSQRLVKRNVAGITCRRKSFVTSLPTAGALASEPALSEPLPSTGATHGAHNSDRAQAPRRYCQRRTGRICYHRQSTLRPRETATEIGRAHV